MYEAATYGERRADIRAAVNTANLIASQTTEPMSDELFRQIVGAISSYMPGESGDDDDDIFDPRALAIVRKGESNVDR